MDKAEAEKELTRLRRQWFAKRKNVVALLRETIFQQESPLVDTDASNKANDADAALQELGCDQIAFGYVTATVTVLDSDPSVADEKLRRIERVIQGHHLGRFITLVRSLSIDPIVVRQNWLDAYDYTTDRGAAVLNDYARTNNPFARVGKESVTVQITSIVRASDASFNVRWTERRYVNGAAAGLERWTAVVSIVLQAPRTEEQLRRNPLGIYVNGLSWSRELDSSEGAKP